MTLSKYIATFILVGIVILQLNASDGLKEYEKTYNESYNFSTSEPFIELDNKYGDIEITTHNDAMAKVTVKVIAETGNEKRAQEIFDRIDIEIKGNATSMSVQTLLRSGNNWNWTKKNEKYNIHYYISIPASSNIEMSNKYGNISCPDINNDIDVELKYGNGDIGNIEGEFKGDFGYTDRLKIGNVEGNADLDLSYSEVEMQGAQNLKINSKYTDFSIGDVNNVKSHSKYDDLSFGTLQTFINTGKYDDIDIRAVQNLDIETQYTDITIDQLNSEGLFDTRFGSVDIREVGSNLETIKIQAHYTGYDIDIDIPYSLEVDTKYTDVDYPRQLDIHNRDKGNTTLYLEGTYLNGGDTKIRAKMKYGQLRL